MSWSRTLIVAGALAMTACGGGGADTPAPEPQPTPTPEPTGTVIVGLTDAPGDFLSYQVDVTSIAFERANGTTIDVLPESTTVDFAQYVEVTELVTAATVPTGAYRSVSLTLDYSTAQIMVEDAAGTAVDATVVDIDDAPITTTTVAVEFEPNSRLVIAPGVPAHVTLDFDLEASHKVELLSAPPTATFDGVLIADKMLEHPKTRRTRGLLKDVDITDSTFSLQVRPFFHPRGDFGRITLTTDADTAFEIDQVALTGADGLDALAQLPEDTAVVALATFDVDTRTLTTTEVLAGSSVPWSQADIAQGTIIARNGDTLTLRGAKLVRKDMSVTFNETLTVTVGPDTIVHQAGAELQPLGVADLSVGQPLTVLGDVTNDGTLDAASGLVRVRFATLGGRVATVAPLEVDLSSLNARRPGLYDFSGTGADASSDAEPGAYEIDSGALALDGVLPGDPIRVLGLVRPFGTAPQDFVANSIANVSAVPAHLRVRWTDGSAALLSADNTRLVLDLAPDTLSPIRYVKQAGVFRDLTDLSETLTLSAPDNGRGNFSLRLDRAQTVYADFDTFSAALSEALDGTRSIERLRATTTVVDAGTYSVRQVLIVLD